MKGKSQGRLRLGEGDAGTQARHHLEPIVIPFEELPSRWGRRIRFQQKARLHRNIQVRNVGGVDAEEFRRCDPGHRERDVVDPNGLSQGRFRTSEAPLTEGKTHHGDRGRSRPIVIGDHQASRGGCDAEPEKIVAGYILAANEVGVTFGCQVQAPGRAEREHAREQ